MKNAKIFGDQPPLLLKDHSAGTLEQNAIMGNLNTALDTASDRGTENHVGRRQVPGGLNNMVSYTMRFYEL